MNITPDTSNQLRSPGRLLIFTGDGKGKTTAALGMALRAGGHGQKVLVLQFIKANQYSGELAALKHIPGVEVRQTGLGFLPSPEDPRFEGHRRAAEQALKQAEEILGSGAFDLIILDEVVTAVTKRLLAEEAVTAAIGNRNGKGVLVLTGRGAGPRLVALADTVTEMKSVKHGLRSGWQAQEGVEF